jgi:hypothetical protein
MDDKKIKKDLEFLAGAMVKEMKALIKMNGSYASGELYNSIKMKVVKDPDETWRVRYNMVYYGLFVDKGTKPGHYPNISSLMEWARFKGIPQDRVPAIAQSIFKKGTKARPFTTPFEEDSKVVKNIMEEMGKSFADDAVDQIMIDAKYFGARIR